MFSDNLLKFPYLIFFNNLIKKYLIMFNFKKKLKVFVKLK